MSDFFERPELREPGQKDQRRPFWQRHRSALATVLGLVVLVGAAVAYNVAPGLSKCELRRPRQPSWTPGSRSTLPSHSLVRQLRTGVMVRPGSCCPPQRR
ncbi:hypothetical protein [Kibdelosporangium philippinense]|uniref:hypothetical protein n=1 Tax=Kibdelosporangium philippinense TaxID=211113 RepID=UPI003609264D